jgi:hypothetical protein
MTTYVYETPDGGGTIYRRMSGNYQRELYKVSERQQQLNLEAQRQAIWQHILQDSKHDSILKDMLDRIEVYYTLKNQP